MRRSTPFILLLTIALAACASSGPAKDVAHPQGADELILRIDLEGGFTLPTFALTHLPTFSLFGDGTIVVGGAQIEIYPSPALPPLVKRSVTEEGIQSILRAARDAGLLGEDREIRNDMVADAGTTVFTVVEGGRTHTTKAYAMDEGGDREAVRSLVRFRNDMTDLQRWLPAGSLGAESSYEADRMRIVVGPYNAAPEPELKQQPKDWPLASDLGKAGIGAVDPYRCVVVTGADLATVLKAAREANSLTPWVSGGKRYLLEFRPLMPDEAECPGSGV